MGSGACRTVSIWRRGCRRLGPAPEPGKVAAVGLDLAGFEASNGSFGHATGDALLRAVAGRLKAAPRTIDSLGRLGGDEFALVRERTRGCPQVEAMRARVLGAFAMPLEVEAARVVVGASLGVAVSEPGADDGRSLLRRAAPALGRANRAGRSLACFDEPWPDGPLVRGDLEREVRQAAFDGLRVDD